MPPAPTSTNLNLYEPAGPEEEFRHRRILMDRAETSIFGPMRQHRQRQSQPYDKDKDDQKDRDRDVLEHYMQSFDILDVDPSQIPDGWKIDDDGYFSLTNDPMDYWEVKAGCVIRHHVRPRRCLFKIKEISDVPIPADLLDANRTTVAKAADGNCGSSTTLVLSSGSWTLNGPAAPSSRSLAKLAVKWVCLPACLPNVWARTQRSRWPNSTRRLPTVPSTKDCFLLMIVQSFRRRKAKSFSRFSRTRFGSLTQWKTLSQSEL